MCTLKGNSGGRQLRTTGGGGRSKIQENFKCEWPLRTSASLPPLLVMVQQLTSQSRGSLVVLLQPVDDLQDARHPHPEQCCGRTLERVGGKTTGAPAAVALVLVRLAEELVDAAEVAHLHRLAAALGGGRGGGRRGEVAAQLCHEPQVHPARFTSDCFLLDWIFSDGCTERMGAQWVNSIVDWKIIRAQACYYLEMCVAG